MSKNEIGAIRIGPHETFVQIPRAMADKFADAARRTGEIEREAGEESLHIERSASGPRDMARENRRRGNADGPRPGPHGDRQSDRPYDRKPHRKGPGGGKGFPPKKPGGGGGAPFSGKPKKPFPKKPRG